MKNSVAQMKIGGRPGTSTTRAAPAEVHPLTKRLNINLPKPVFDGLETIAKNSGRTMTEVVRVALGLVAVAIEEEQSGNRLVITKRNGDLLREIVLPK